MTKHFLISDAIVVKPFTNTPRFCCWPKCPAKNTIHLQTAHHVNYEIPFHIFCAFILVFFLKPHLSGCHYRWRPLPLFMSAKSTATSHFRKLLFSTSHTWALPSVLPAGLSKEEIYCQLRKTSKASARNTLRSTSEKCGTKFTFSRGDLAKKRLFNILLTFNFTYLTCF